MTGAVTERPRSPRFLYRPERLAVYEQQQYGAQRRDEEPRSLTWLIPANGAAEEPSEEGTHDADQHRDEHAAGIATGHDQFRDDSHNEPKEHPTQHPNHGNASLAVPSSPSQRAPCDS